MHDIASFEVAGAAKAILSRSLSPIDLTEHMLEPFDEEMVLKVGHAFESDTD
jgi:hypothetical protein